MVKQDTLAPTCEGVSEQPIKPSSDVADAQSQLDADLRAELLQAERKLENTIYKDVVEGNQITGTFDSSIGEFDVKLNVDSGGVAISKQLDFDINGEISSRVKPEIGFFGLGKDYRGVQGSLDAKLSMIKKGLLIETGVNTGTHYAASGDQDGFKNIKVSDKENAYGYVGLTLNEFSVSVDTEDRVKTGYDNGKHSVTFDSDGRVEAGIKFKF